MQHFELIGRHKPVFLKCFKHTGRKNYHIGLATPKRCENLRVILKKEFALAEEFVRIVTGFLHFSERGEPPRYRIGQSGRNRLAFQVPDVLKIVSALERHQHGTDALVGLLGRGSFAGRNAIRFNAFSVPDGIGTSRRKHEVRLDYIELRIAVGRQNHTQSKLGSRHGSAQPLDRRYHHRALATQVGSVRHADRHHRMHSAFGGNCPRLPFSDRHGRCCG